MIIAAQYYISSLWSNLGFLNFCTTCIREQTYGNFRCCNHREVISFGNQITWIGNWNLIEHIRWPCYVRCCADFRSRRLKCRWVAVVSTHASATVVMRHWPLRQHPPCWREKRADERADHIARWMLPLISLHTSAAGNFFIDQAGLLMPYYEYSGDDVSVSDVVSTTLIICDQLQPGDKI